MRIISGMYKGRTLKAPSNLPVRPTTDFARTGLFNILNSLINFSDISFLDLFCGTGIISLEMASRGCNNIIAVDNNRNCTQFLQHTIASWEIRGVRVIRSDVFKFIDHSNIQVDLVFVDPPYSLPKLTELPGLISSKKLVKPGGILILEHGKENSFESFPNFDQLRTYGNVNFSIFQF